MADYAIFKDYLAQIEQACKAGNATEHTHRPALKSLLEAFQPGITATNEPKRIQCGAPDYIITRKDVPLGFVEAKDIGMSLDDTESSEQLKRYRDSLANLILTDYLEFRWYVSGELRLTARLAKPLDNGKLRAEAEGVQQLDQLLQSFFAENIPVISSPKELATRMAALARLIRSIIGKTFAEEGEHGALQPIQFRLRPPRFALPAGGRGGQGRGKIHPHPCRLRPAQNQPVPAQALRPHCRA